MELIDLTSLTFEELSEALRQFGLPSFRAGQIYRWIARGVTDFNEMSDLSKDLRLRLSEDLSFPP